MRKYRRITEGFGRAIEVCGPDGAAIFDALHGEG
jgi:hypothetical protein